MVAANLTLPAAIRALLLTGVYTITVQDVAVPQLLSLTDAIMRLTPSAICGSDLFAYSGFAPEQPPHVPGHEGIGYVARVGSAVAALSAGDYVVILNNLHHGQLLFPNLTVPALSPPICPAVMVCPYLRLYPKAHTA